MKGAALVGWIVFAVWVAGILQYGLAPHLAIGLGQPDFGLIALSTLGCYCNRRGLTGFGFAVGWVAGALAGLNLTLYVLSRSTAGFLMGWSLGLGVQRNAIVSAIAAVGVTLVSSLIMLFAGAHKGPLMPYLLGTLITTVYDGVIAALLFGGINRLADPRRLDRY